MKNEKQARAVGKYFAGLRIHAIYASPLLRAYATAEQIQIHQLSDPKPTLVPSDLLREQHFGDAEGQPFTWSHLLNPARASSSSPSKGQDKGQRNTKGAYTPLADRQSRFPNGESSDDVARRVDNFISEFIIPHVLASLPDYGHQPLNIFIVSHGIAIAEVIGAFLRREPTHTAPPSESWRGLVNTGWTQLTVSLQVRATLSNKPCLRWSDIDNGFLIKPLLLLLGSRPRNGRAINCIVS